MRQSVLTDSQAQFLREEKEALAGVQFALAKLDLSREALASLQKAILQLDELFLIVIAGEFNAGKSALINALLGQRVLPEGTTPTTSRVTLIKWGEQPNEQVVDESFSVYTYPLALLKELNIVDTPGTNAIIRHHERLTDEFVPRSDLVLFVTSADHPLTESERQFLERILAWGKKIVFVLNKVDIFEDDSSLQEVRSFILTHATKILGDQPQLLPVSAKLAQRSVFELDTAERTRLRSLSHIDELERYITATLDDKTRLQLKFNNPLGVAERLIEQAGEELSIQSESINEDKTTAASLETVITAYERELQSELPPRLAEIENILYRLEQRGLDFFDTTLRLTNVQNLMRGDKVRAEFEKQVLSDVPRQIEEQVQRLIDWLVQKDLHEWQQVMSYLQRRRAQNLDHLVGEGYGPRETRRRELIETVGRSVQKIVNTYDRDKEARELAASTMAVLGFFVIPYKRKQAKDKFKAKMQDLRAKLVDALTKQFKDEREIVIARLRDGVAPYTRFVHSELERMETTETTLAELRQKLSALRARAQAVLK